MLSHQRDDIEVASLQVDVGSCWRQLSYPRGNFSDITLSHEETMSGSLGPAFATRTVVGLVRVKPAFPLAVCGRFLTSLS
jgi:hypothetical protein